MADQSRDTFSNRQGVASVNSSRLSRHAWQPWRLRVPGFDPTTVFLRASTQMRLMRATTMSALSERAAAILEQMEPDRGYEASELKAFAPNLNLEALREVMHELWIARQVERYRDTGWRRAGSTCGPRETLEPTNAVRCASADTGTGDAASRRIGNVRPEDLFDHASFAGWFK